MGDRPPWLPRLRALLTSGMAWMLFGVVFYLGIYSERTGFVNDILDPGLKKITLPVLNAFRSDPLAVANIQLDIAPMDMDSIISIRNRALEIGVLIEGKDRWFPVQITADGKELSGKIRLKGGLTDHLQDSKWSYRVKLDSGQLFLGCKRFSLQHPNTRNFSYEWLFHKALEQEGLPAINYDFVRMDVNGEDLGIFAFEEHFHKKWSETREGIEGPVMKYDDEYRLIAISETPESAYDPTLHPLASWFTAPIDAFQTGKVLNDETTRDIFEQNARALAAFRSGESRTSEVFDVEASGRLFAVADLLGAQHAQDWRNLRFVRSATNGLLVPIGFDGNAGEKITLIRALREQGPIDFELDPEDGFYEKLFADTLFYLAYMNELERISDPVWLRSFLERNDDLLQQKLKIIKSEFPRFSHDPEIFEHSRIIIERSVYRTPLLKAQLLDKEGSFEAASLNGLPIEILELRCGTKTLRINRLVKPSAINTPLTFDTIDVPHQRLEDVNCELICRTFGTDTMHAVQFSPWITH